MLYLLKNVMNNIFIICSINNIEIVINKNNKHQNQNTNFFFGIYVLALQNERKDNYENIILIHVSLI